GDLVGSEFVEPRTATGIDHNSIRTRVLGGRSHQVHLPRFSLEVSDEVRELGGEPHVAGSVEDHRVRILRGLIRHAIHGALSGRGIEPADAPIPVTGEPDPARLVYDKIVRVRSCSDLVALEASLGGVKIGDVVPFLTDEPDPPLRVEVRIARPRFLPGYLPFGHL